MNWGYLYTPIQTRTFECGYTPAYWGYTKYECDYTPITWGYPNAPSIGDMLLNAFIWHFRSHAGNAQMGTSPVGSVSTFPLAESDVCPRFTPFTNAHPRTPHTPHQGRRQGKSLGGRRNLGVRGAAPPAGVQGAEPVGGGQGPKPPKAEAFLVLKS